MTGCSSSQSPEISTEKKQLSNEEAKALDEAPSETSVMQAAIQQAAEDEAGTPPQPETPMEPVDVKTLPFFQDQEEVIMDPILLEARSAKSLEDCNKYEGQPKEICERAVGLPTTSDPGELVGN